MSLLADHAWSDLARSPGLLAVPVGATEQHGPHLPLSTDTDIACAIAAGLAAANPEVVIAPPLAYGASGEHEAFAGTVSIGASAVELMLVELARSATRTFERLVFISTHGGNARPVARAVRRLRGEGRDVHAWAPSGDWTADAHAGCVETSAMLAIAPSRVRRAAAVPGNVEPLAALLPRMQSGGVVAVSENGVLGNPVDASADHGELLLSTAIADLVAAVDAWRADGPDWL